jgi:hypothetical protein
VHPKPTALDRELVRLSAHQPTASSLKSA